MHCMEWPSDLGGSGLPIADAKLPYGAVPAKQAVQTPRPANARRTSANKVISSCMVHVICHEVMTVEPVELPSAVAWLTDGPLP